MILNKGECVTFKTDKERSKVAKLLSEEGYRMWYDGDVSVAGAVAIRWCALSEFPKCLATLSQDMVDEITHTGALKDADGTHSFVLISANELLSGVNRSRIAFDDLL